MQDCSSDLDLIDRILDEQNRVLEQLDELNNQIELALKQCLASRPAPEPQTIAADDCRRHAA